MTALSELRTWRASQWRPAPRLHLSEWADRHFVLPEGDANAGRWTTLPYQRGILDAISDPRIERVTVMKSARVGYTRSFCAAIGYFIAHDPCPILVVQPTIDDAQKHSKEDIAPMLRDVAVLKGLVAESKAKTSGNTILDKRFRGGSLSLVGANSPRGFRRTSRRVVIFDEVDGYPPSAGTEGDQIELGIRRTEYYWNRKILAGSTPTIAGASRIERLFEAGDQRRYYIPCPTCGSFQVLRFPNLKWPSGRTDAAYFICDVHGCMITYRDQRPMIEAGVWRAEAPTHFTDDNRHASFHIWSAYSYSPNATWGQLAAEFEKANRMGPTTLKTFVTTVLGEPWQERGEAPDWARLMRRRETYPIGTVPLGALFLTAGVDVQKDRLVYEVVGWGRGKTSWSIDAGTIPGDTADLARGPWSQLDALLSRMFPHARGVDLPIRMLAIDSGYNTQHIYAWAQGHPMSRVITVKGQGHGGALIGAPAPVHVTSRGTKVKRGGKVWPVASHIAKSELYGWLRLELPIDGTPPPPGYCHFPEHDEPYFRELTAEHLVTHQTRTGFVRLEWALIPGRTNHALDARIYARAAAAVVGLDRFTESDWRALERATGLDPEAPDSPPAPLPTGPPAMPVPRHPARRTSWLMPRSDAWLPRRAPQ